MIKKLYPLLSVLFLIYWGCEEQDTTPTEVTLWGVVYSVENTTELDLSDNDLSGSIPPEIGNLTNLTYLNLCRNNLTGVIPDEICNQGDNSPIFTDNRLCPPYPSCIENSVGDQHTSDFP